MSAKGLVVLPDKTPPPPGRSVSLKLRSGDTGDSVMIFEEVVPPGTKSTLHFHHDSDEICHVLSGEVTFLIGDDVTVGGPGTYAFMPRNVPHAWKSTGAEDGRAIFAYTPGKAGGLLEEQKRTGRKFAEMNESELADILNRHGWTLLGDSPL